MRENGLRVVVITGASRGIGAATARRMAADGYAVVIGYARDQAGAEAVRDAIVSAGGKAAIVRGDLADADQAPLIERARAAFGCIDVLVNNAAVVDPRELAVMDAAHVDGTLLVNVRGLLLASRYAAAAMEPGGCIVNVSSTNARRAVPTASVYAASKAAVEALTKTLAAELGPRGIRVNAVAPGLIMTEWQTARLSPDVLTTVVAETPLGRLGQPEDIAAVIAFLASTDAGWITGETITASGGNGL